MLRYSKLPGSLLPTPCRFVPEHGFLCQLPLSKTNLQLCGCLFASLVTQLVKEISNFMLEVGRLDIQGRVGEVGWVVGRVMEGLLISSKTAFASPSDPATRANLAALAKVSKICASTQRRFFSTNVCLLNHLFLSKHTFLSFCLSIDRHLLSNITRSLTSQVDLWVTKVTAHTHIHTLTSFPN